MEEVLVNDLSKDDISLVLKINTFERLLLMGSMDLSSNNQD